MQSYKVSTEYYFKEIGQKVKAGSEIELREGDAQRYMESYPGLPSIARLTIEGQPFLIQKLSGSETPADTESPEETANKVEAPATAEVDGEAPEAL